MSQEVNDYDKLDDKVYTASYIYSHIFYSFYLCIFERIIMVGIINLVVLCSVEAIIGCNKCPFEVTKIFCWLSMWVSV